MKWVLSVLWWRSTSAHQEAPSIRQMDISKTSGESLLKSPAHTKWALWALKLDIVCSNLWWQYYSTQVPYRHEPEFKKYQQSYEKLCIKVGNSLKLHKENWGFCGYPVHTHVGPDGIKQKMGIAITWFKKGIFSSVKINTIQFLLPKNIFNSIPKPKQAVLML